ncbi:glycosyltransferase [Clostridium estertheticum]|uniref:glycosyltransferase n=1 Tax=Clostridium estertheticum TaxID=238834 RepID=UPI001C0C017F|nr:glycosyltransferase [Clostridium estertheticum]MBU3213951.1 glycosyltransferase [Clostridium estertheticum]WAG53828.1 glycosyltransferase [Clostridium estertheticum]
MKVVIVNCFDTYEDRIDLLHDYFIDKGHDVTIIQSNFRHFKKVKRTESKQDFIFVESKPYYKNMSVARLSSHYSYAKKAFQLVDDLQPDLLYVMVPPNSLVKFAAKYKRKHSNVKLIFDLIDLWPETMPIGKIKAIPPFTFWKLMRDKNLKYADLVITECNLYQSILKNVLKGIKAETVYLAKGEVNVESHPMFNKDEIHLCYLGSINNIIDIPQIKRLVKLIHEIKPVTLHIIGDGEKRDDLIDEVKSTGAIVEYHGKIYDPQKKQEIFDKCQFGLNIMKDTVCVGLTMKSIDYFQAGLPILNSIKADTSKIVEEYKIGINVAGENIEDIAYKVANDNMEKLLVMRENTKKMFDSLFSLDAFNRKLHDVIKGL